MSTYLAVPSDTARNLPEAVQSSAAVWLAAPLAPHPASAQVTTATVSGSVRDTTGGALPGATVVLESEARGTKAAEAVTNANGDFVFPNVTGDLYTVVVRMSGFKTLKRTGIAVTPGDRVSLGSLTIEIGGLTEKVAASFVAFYWGGAMVGRFIGSALLQKMKTGGLLGICAVCAAGLVAISMLTSGHFAMYSIILVGLFNSIMFPSIFTLGVAELGPLTGDGSGIMIMAIVGGAIIPVAQGWIADHIGIHHAFFLPVICYVYILFFALSGSKPNSERYAKA